MIILFKFKDENPKLIGYFDVKPESGKTIKFHRNDMTLFGEEMIIGKYLDLSGPNGIIVCGLVAQNEGNENDKAHFPGVYLYSLAKIMSLCGKGLL